MFDGLSNSVRQGRLVDRCEILLQRAIVKAFGEGQGIVRYTNLRRRQDGSGDRHKLLNSRYRLPPD